MKEIRKLKPQIPEIGENGILLRDEIELERNLVLVDYQQAASS